MRRLFRICTSERIILLILLAMCLYNIYVLSEFDHEFGDALYLYTLDEESFSRGKPILWMDTGSGAQSTLIQDEHGILSISSHLIYRHYLLTLYLLVCSLLIFSNGNSDRILPLMVIVGLVLPAVFILMSILGINDYHYRSFTFLVVYSLLAIGFVQGLFYHFFLPEIDQDLVLLNIVFSVLFLFPALTLCLIYTLDHPSLHIDNQERRIHVAKERYFYSYESEMDFSDVNILQWRYRYDVEGEIAQWYWSLYTTEYEESMLSDIAKKPQDGVLLTFQESAHGGLLSENLPDLESHRVLCRLIAVRVNATCLPSVAVPHED